MRASFCKLYPPYFYRPEALRGWRSKGPLASQNGQALRAGPVKPVGLGALWVGDRLKERAVRVYV